MKGYDLIPNQFKLLQKREHIFQLCKERCKVKKAEFLKQNVTEEQMCRTYF